MTLVDDPTLPDAFGAATHDGEGVPTRRVELIVDGTLLGLPPQRVHRAPVGDDDDRLRGARLQVDARRSVRARCTCARARSRRTRSWPSVPEALYVQSVSGLHSGTNPVSGDFSVGAEGLMVRDGAFAEPVREITIASTLQRMLLDVAEVGRRPHVAARRRRGRHPAAHRHDDDRQLTRPFSARSARAQRAEAAG